MEKTQDWIKHIGYNCPVDGEAIVQLKLSNGNTPINKANVFYWGAAGRGTTYPTIEAYKLSDQVEFDKYIAEVKAFRDARAVTELQRKRDKEQENMTSQHGENNPEAAKAAT